MSDSTERGTSSTECGSAVAQDMKNLEQESRNEPNDSGDTASPSTAPPPKTVKNNNMKVEQADMPGTSSAANEDNAAQELNVQEQSANKKQAVKVGDAASNPEPVLPDYEESGNEDVWKALRSGKTTFMLVKLPNKRPVGGVQGIPERTSFRRDLEGKCAKVSLLITGHIHLTAGSSTYEVRNVTHTTLPHELISIVHDDETNKDNLVVMGPDPHKIIIEPDWETLYRKLLCIR